MEGAGRSEKGLERETGFEPATPTLARSCSTTELFPRHSRRCYHDRPVPALRASAASSGGTGLMKTPLPHSNPATRVSFGITSRCQWNDSSWASRNGAVCSMKLNGGSPSTWFMRRRTSPSVPATPRSSSSVDSSNAARWCTGRIHVSNGNRGANGASATKSGDSSTSRPRPRRSWRIMSHQTHRSLRSKYWAEPASSSATMIGMIGVAMSCECGCSSEAPAASPWFLNTRTYANRGSFLRSSMRSRNANNTSATASTERPAREASCRGVSMMTQRPTTGSLRSSGIALAVLPLHGPLEQRGQCIRRRLALEEHGADLVADRQCHRVAARERQRRDDRARALGDHARLALDGGRGAALREGHAELAVAREASGTREHEIPETGQPRHGPGDGAERHRQARHLGQTARDERGARVLAEAEAVGDAGRDGHHVLQGAAHLDADHVTVRVEPELPRAEPPLERGGQRVVPRRDHRRGRTREGD